MTTAAQPSSFFVTRHPAVAVLGYVAVVAIFISTAGYATTDLYQRYEAVAASNTLLDQLEGRTPSSRRNSGAVRDEVPSGSPYLEGQTVTVAGAALLQRVIGAVTRVGGQVLSSQVDLQGEHAKDDYVGVIANCEVEQPALQQLLYDIEAGMPFLFVDQLTVQAPEGGAENGGRMRVMLGVSGQWRGRR